MFPANTGASYIGYDIIDRFLIPPQEAQVDVRLLRKHRGRNHLPRKALLSSRNPRCLSDIVRRFKPTPKWGVQTAVKTGPTWIRTKGQPVAVAVPVRPQLTVIQTGSSLPTSNESLRAPARSTCSCEARISERKQPHSSCHSYLPQLRQPLKALTEAHDRAVSTCAR